MEQNQNPRQEVERRAGPKNRKSRWDVGLKSGVSGPGRPSLVLGAPLAEQRPPPVQAWARVRQGSVFLSVSQSPKPGPWPVDSGAGSPPPGRTPKLRGRRCPARPAPYLAGAVLRRRRRRRRRRGGWAAQSHIVPGRGGRSQLRRGGPAPAAPVPQPPAPPRAPRCVPSGGRFREGWGDPPSAARPGAGSGGPEGGGGRAASARPAALPPRLAGPLAPALSARQGRSPGASAEPPAPPQSPRCPAPARISRNPGFDPPPGPVPGSPRFLRHPSPRWAFVHQDPRPSATHSFREARPLSAPDRLPDRLEEGPESGVIPVHPAPPFPPKLPQNAFLGLGSQGPRRSCVLC
uniref:Basic proline-rich protein-like n=1 Tax=Callorhinus ursinus TaxID=34884 RepID=A0A3Q7Q6G6_CALUR|nr:basic proline-rich protein-like [Callorhinus ursinus]